MESLIVTFRDDNLHSLSIEIYFAENISHKCVFYVPIKVLIIPHLKLLFHLFLGMHYII